MFFGGTTKNTRVSDSGVGFGSKKIPENVPDFETVMKDKLVAFQSDSEHTQIACNRLLAAEFGRMIPTLPCTLHGCSNIESKAHSCLHKSAQQVIHLCMLLFGSRLKSGYRRHSLKESFNAVLGRSGPNAISIFKSTTGCRVKARVTNALAVVVHEESVLKVLESSVAKENKWAVELIGLMKGDEWPSIKSQLVFMPVVWSALAKPMFNALTKPVKRESDLKFR
jgi:hypothetical protein